MPRLEVLQRCAMLVALCGLVVSMAHPTSGAEPPQPLVQSQEKTSPAELPTKIVELLPGQTVDKDDLVRLSKVDSVWVDRKSKNVIVAGTVCMRQGPLEMFACPRGTKEYESVVSVDSKAQTVHAALLAVGMTPGTPVEFQPIYKSATGPRVEVTAIWRDPKTKELRKVRGQQWVRHVKTQTAMSEDWVFAGSGFWKDPDSGEEFYQAEGGELICVSNFGTATMDLPIASPQGNEDLFFNAFTENIPPLGTRVWLVLRKRKRSTGGSPVLSSREVDLELLPSLPLHNEPTRQRRLAPFRCQLTQDGVTTAERFLFELINCDIAAQIWKILLTA